MPLVSHMQIVGFPMRRLKCIVLYWYDFHRSFVHTGILVEGIDCILSSTVGIGYGVTSCSQNIGVISLTKVYKLKVY